MDKVKVINNTRYKNIPLDFFDYLCEKYEYMPKKVIVDYDKNDRGYNDTKTGIIYIYPSKTETKKSYKWLIAHEYFHIFCAANKHLYKYIYGHPSDLSDAIEETFCSMLATFEANGCYDLNWYLRRKNEQVARKQCISS